MASELRYALVSNDWIALKHMALNSIGAAILLYGIIPSPVNATSVCGIVCGAVVNKSSWLRL